MNSSPVHPGIQVHLPDCSIIESSHKANLNLPDLPAEAGECHIFPALTSRSLLSIGQLCDHDGEVTFTKLAFTVHRDSKIVMQGTRDPENGLWSIPVPTAPPLSLQTMSQHLPHIPSPTELLFIIPPCSHRPFRHGAEPLMQATSHHGPN
jgi:hypothetical protein